MIHLALRTEYSFKKTLLPIGEVHKYVVDGVVGIADINNTYGHNSLQNEARKHGFKPIYGVRLAVVKEGWKKQTCQLYYVFIAKNYEGLSEMYKLVQMAWEGFYYFPRLLQSQLEGVSDNLIVIAPNGMGDYQGVGQGWPTPLRGQPIAIDNNSYANIEDKYAYQLMAGARRQGKGYSYNFDDQTYPQHIMPWKEWDAEYSNMEAMTNTLVLADQVESFDIPKAEMIKWKGTENIWSWCNAGRKKVKNWTQEYEDRLVYELELIEDKDYVDYFLITADMIQHAKKTMLVGPARGSSAGSLVCYLLDITEVDPIEHKLIFERFIDINRFDLPDIDCDFPDAKREAVVQYLKHKYGRDKVMCLANINRLKAKSAIGEFVKALGIPAYEADGVKGAIIERSSGDARAAMQIADTFETTEPGREFIERYPAMALVSRVEDHAAHAGKHAAGILVSTLPLSQYASLNPRDEVVMLDKKDAEDLNLLKVDCLGLRNLTILEGVADQIGMEYKDFYSLPLDDAKTYELFNALRLNGVFQFEGQALQMIVKQMGVRNFNDISAITALARPGALNSGGAARYIKYVTGLDSPTFLSDTHKQITEATFGIVVYQEQMMEIARECGGLSWADVQTLRKAASKSMGDEFFGKFRNQFTEGAKENGYTEEEAISLWSDISSSGSWSFNKSHAVSYGLVSYWTAWAKANHPMEFAVACLNHTPDPDSGKKLLRDLIQNEGVDYVPVDPDLSGLHWSYSGNTLIGGLTNIKGIANVKAKKILAARKSGASLTPALYKVLMDPKTPYDILFPTDHYWGHLYRDPLSYQLDGKPMFIKDIDGIGEYIFIGVLVDRNLRDLNEQVFLEKRGGRRIEEYTQYLNFKVEDDTDMISCKIDRYKYDSIGREIAETGRLDKDWFLVRGTIKGDWRVIDVKEIVNLGKYFPGVVED